MLPSTQITIADLYRVLVGLQDTMSKLAAHIERIDGRNETADRIHADHESRIRMAEQLAAQTATNTTQLVKDGGDQEGRMRALEKFRWQIAGALIVLNALAVVVEWLIWSKK